jgi:chorismate dehydratase
MENMAGSEITLSAVEYLNTKPFLEGLSRHSFNRPLRISQDTPAQCSLKLHEGRADIGIVPVADLPRLKGFRRITRWGIAARGTVESVLMVANQPVNELDRIFLDYQSKTSNQLMRILAEEYFKWDGQYGGTEPGYEQDLPAGTGAVIIGDRALRSGGQYRYRYDLAQAWLELTGLPFVFAVWVASKRVDAALEDELEMALGKGMAFLSEISERYRFDFPQIDVYQYLTHHVHYEITRPHEEGMELFLEKIAMLEGIL